MRRVRATTRRLDNLNMIALLLVFIIAISVLSGYVIGRTR